MNYSTEFRQEPSDSPSPSRTASRIVYSMRRSFSSAGSSKKKRPNSPSDGMYSTVAERSPPSAFRLPDASSTYHTSQPPTTQQIAMGLHLSRTPHLGTPQQRAPTSPYGRPPHARHLSLQGLGEERGRMMRSVQPLPPPPLRSSLKKSSVSTSTTTSTSTLTPPTSLGLSAASTSTSTVTSTASSNGNPRHSQSMRSLKLRMPNFTRAVSRSSVSSANEAQTPRKAVRFSTGIPGLDDPVSPGQ